MAVADLVAERPHDHRGMVAVGAHPRAHVALVPRLEEIRIAVLPLAGRADVPPFVEHLVLHQKPELVAEVEEVGILGVVRTADGVHAGLLQLEEAALHRGAVVGRAQHAEIVVDAHAVQRHAASVQLEPARVGVERDRADAVAERLALQLERVEVGVVDVPEARVVDGEHARFLAGLRHFPAHVDGRPLLRDLRRGDRDGAGDEVIGRTEREAAFAVHAAARVPARGIDEVVAAHNERVLAVELQVRREVAAERGVAVGPAAHVRAVHPYLRVAHHAVRLKEEESAGLDERDARGVETEGTPIPADAGRLKVGVAVRLRRIERLLHAPVVRHAHGAPRRRVGLGRGTVRAHELPPVRQAHALNAAESRQRTRAGKNHCKMFFVHGGKYTTSPPIPPERDYLVFGGVTKRMESKRAS